MTKTQMTREQFKEFIAAHRGNLPYAADLREQLREKLATLPAVALAVYAHDNLLGDDVTAAGAAATVLYSFDAVNFAAVAKALELEPAALQLVLIAYLLGQGE